jgi:hypothetical protein
MRWSLTIFAKLLSTLKPLASRIESRRFRPPDTQSGWSISLDSALENVSTFATVVNSDPPSSLKYPLLLPSFNEF